MSGEAFCPCRASRCEIQRGSSSRDTGQTGTSTPAPASAANHADDCAALSSFGSVTTVTLSGFGFVAYASSAFAPSTPGLPVGMRRSTRRREPNRPRFALFARNASQRNWGSTTNTSRSSQPARRAAARTASPASSASSGSSPWIT